MLTDFDIDVSVVDKGYKDISAVTFIVAVPVTAVSLTL